MLLIYPQFSPFTAIKLRNCFSHQWPHGEIPEQFPSSPTTELGRTLYFVVTGCVDTQSKV